MERSVARDFHDKVQELIEDVSEREALFQALRDFQKNHNLERLVENMRDVVTSPERMCLYDDIRPLVPLKHQIDYDRMLPPGVTGKLRVVRLRRRGHESLGFSVRGGLEHGIGIYVSQVDQDSQAYYQGLRAGDQIVRVNGFTIEQAIHEEVLNLLKAKNEIVLKVRHVGMLPTKMQGNDIVTWQYVESVDAEKTLQHVLDNRQNKTVLLDNRDIKMFINIPLGMGMGASICSGPPQQPGIFIQRIKAGSLAEEAGLEVGDQLINVNGISFFGISHGEAVMALKGSRQLDVVIRKNAGANLFRPKSPILSTEELKEKEKILQLKELAVQREKERQIKKDRENKLLDTERQKEEMEKRLDEQHQLTQRRLLQLEKQQQEAVERLAKEKAQQEKEALGWKNKEHMTRKEKEEKETLMQQQQEEHEQRVKKMQQELYEIKQREQEQREKMKEQEREKERMKRIRKEQEMLAIVQQQELKGLVKEQKMKASRLQQETEEAIREKERSVSQTPGAQRRNTSVSLKPVDQEVRVQHSTSAQFTSIGNQPMYWKENQNNFRIQKPVLLSPVESTDSSSKSGTKNPLYVAVDDDDISEASFNPEEHFTPEQIAGRQVNLVKIRRNGLRDIALEGGLGSPLGGKIVVMHIIEGGLVAMQGGIHKGDQIMMVDGKSLLDVSLLEAEHVIDLASERVGVYAAVIVAKAPPKDYEDEITYF